MSKYFQVTFPKKDSNAVQTYININTFVPVRWNDKASDPRVVIYRVAPETLESFKGFLHQLTQVQGREITFQRVREVYCTACGAEYTFRADNRTGPKTCAECGGTEFTSQ